MWCEPRWGSLHWRRPHGLLKERFKSRAFKLCQWPHDSSPLAASQKPREAVVLSASRGRTRGEGMQTKAVKPLRMLVAQTNGNTSRTWAPCIPGQQTPRCQSSICQLSQKDLEKSWNLIKKPVVYDSRVFVWQCAQNLGTVAHLASENNRVVAFPSFCGPY